MSSCAPGLVFGTIIEKLVR